MKMYWSYKSLPELSGLPVAEAKLLYKKASEIAQGSDEGIKGMVVMLTCAGAGGALGSAIGGVLQAAGGAAIGCTVGGIYFDRVIQNKVRALLREQGYPRA